MIDVLELLSEWRLPFESEAWTGRPFDAGSPVEMVRGRWHGLLWPDYRCEDCTGTGQGCYCAYHGAISPGVGPEPWRVWLRKFPRRWRRWWRGQ